MVTDTHFYVSGSTHPHTMSEIRRQWYWTYKSLIRCLVIRKYATCTMPLGRTVAKGLWACFIIPSYQSSQFRVPVQSADRWLKSRWLCLAFFWRYEHLRPAHKTMANYCIINFPGNYRQPTKAGIIETSYTGYATNF